MYYVSDDIYAAKNQKPKVKHFLAADKTLYKFTCTPLQTYT